MIFIITKYLDIKFIQFAWKINNNLLNLTFLSQDFVFKITEISVTYTFENEY